MTPKLTIPKMKSKLVRNLAEEIKNAETLIIVSIKGLPSKQFQEIKKSIREHALIKVTKKNIALRAIKSLKDDSILKLEEYIKENYAFVISDIGGFELARILSKKKTPVFAKAGQTALKDIEIKKGPTDLVPGPAISELGALGIQIAVEEGKITIKKSKVIVTEGKIIDENVASILQKLNIQPFNIGLEPIAIYDIKTKKIYLNIEIDSEKTKENLKKTIMETIGFAQQINYYCKETIRYFLKKAGIEEKSLIKLQSVNNIKQKTKIEKENNEKIKKINKEIEKKSEESKSSDDKKMSGKIKNE